MHSETECSGGDQMELIHGRSEEFALYDIIIWMVWSHYRARKHNSIILPNGMLG